MTVLMLGLASALLVVVPSPAQPVHAEELGAWMHSTSYPAAVADESCVTSGGFLYCVGGFVPQNGYTNAVHYAPHPSELFAFPNPIVRGNALTLLDRSFTDVKMINTLGVCVLRTKTGSLLTIPANLTPGTYWLESSKNGKPVTQKILVTE